MSTQLLEDIEREVMLFFNLLLLLRYSCCIQNVIPDPIISCGPYHPIEDDKSSGSTLTGNEENHDTIGILAIDLQGRTAAGTSTNGAKHKISGRVEDSLIAGAGAYADQRFGAAASTGDGDIMMRFCQGNIMH